MAKAVSIASAPLPPALPSRAKGAAELGNRGQAGWAGPGFESSLALGFVPVVADPDVDGERRIEAVGAAHLGADELTHGAELCLRYLEQELVVHLENQPRVSTFFAEAAVDRHHRHFDDVGVRALHDEVDRQALAEGAGLALRGTDLRDRAAATQQGGDVAVFTRLIDRALDEVLHVREAGEVRVDVRLRLVAVDAEVLRKPVRGDAVD